MLSAAGRARSLRLEVSGTVRCHVTDRGRGTRGDGVQGLERRGTGRGPRAVLREDDHAQCGEPSDAGAKGETGVRLGGEERGKHCNQGIGQDPGDPRTKGCNGEAGSHPHAATAEYEAGEGGEGAGYSLLMTSRRLHGPPP